MEKLLQNENIKAWFRKQRKRFIQAINPEKYRTKYRFHEERYKDLVKDLSLFEKKVPIIVDRKAFSSTFQEQYYRNLLKDFPDRVSDLSEFTEYHKKQVLLSHMPKELGGITYSYLVGEKEVFIRSQIFPSETALTRDHEIASSGNEIFMKEENTSSVVVFREGKEELKIIRRWRVGFFPGEITISPSGTIYLLNYNNIKSYDLEGHLLRERMIDKGGSDLDILSEENSEFLLVAGEYKKGIQVYTSIGDFVEEWKTAFEPGQIKVSNGRIYYASRSRIMEYDRKEGRSRKFGNLPAGEKMNIVDIAASPDGKIYVCDRDLPGIRVFSSEREYLRKIGSSSQFKDLKGITILPNGDIYVLDEIDKHNIRFQLFRTVAL